MAMIKNQPLMGLCNLPPGSYPHPISNIEMSYSAMHMIYYVRVANIHGDWIIFPLTKDMVDEAPWPLKLMDMLCSVESVSSYGSTCPHPVGKEILMAGGPRNCEMMTYCGGRVQLQALEPMPELPDLGDADCESLTTKVTYEVYTLEQLATTVASKDPLMPPNVCTMRVYRHSSVPVDSLYPLVLDIFKEFPLTRFYAAHVPFWSKKL